MKGSVTIKMSKPNISSKKFIINYCEKTYGIGTGELKLLIRPDMKRVKRWAWVFKDNKLPIVFCNTIENTKKFIERSLIVNA